MNAHKLLDAIKARGGVASVRHGDDGAAVLNVAPRHIALDFASDIQRFKPSLVEELERAQAVADLRVRQGRLRFDRLEAAFGVEGACRAIYAMGRRLEREQPRFWRGLNASDRHELAVCVAMLESRISPETSRVEEI